MLEKYLPWIGGVFAAVGLILIICDVIFSIKRREKARLNVIGLVILSIAVIGYVTTDIILRDSAWPPLASLVWIALFWVYVILDAWITLNAIKKARKDRVAAAVAKSQESLKSVKEQEQYATYHSVGGLIWRRIYSGREVPVEIPSYEVEQSDASPSETSESVNK